MKVAIYLRVSTAEQNLDNQRLRLTEYARQKDWDYEVFSEVQSSRNTRPVKAELLQRLRKKEYDGILVYRLDRYARSSTELILEIEELIKKEIVFISYSEHIDFSTPMGKLQFQILAAFAEFERSLISERTKEGIRRALLKGKTLGRPKGSKDKKKRRKSGYILRMAKERQKSDKLNGVFMDIGKYLDT